MNHEKEKPEAEDGGIVLQAHPIALPDGKEKVPLGSGVVTNLLRCGGMGSVYEIWNSQLEIYRAVKIINPGSSEAVLQRFTTEMKISAKLKHQNIVEIHSVGKWNGLPYIEMEKVDGLSLDQIVAERGGLSAEVCTSIGIMICRALNYAHTQDYTIYGNSYHGIIHRDLKPGNIMISSKGVVKLMDFGIARPVDVSFHTMDGVVMGTLPYLAPEQIDKSPLDFRTDIYAFGATMYEIITGTAAFTQTNFGQLVSSKTKNKFLPLKAFPVKIPNRLNHIICKCMHQDSQKRVENASVLLHELEKIHAKLIDESPENVLTQFMADKNVEKHVFAPRRLFPWKTAVSLSLAVAVPIAVFHYGWSPFSLFHFKDTRNSTKPVFLKDSVNVRIDTASEVRSNYPIKKESQVSSPEKAKQEEPQGSTKKITSGIITKNFVTEKKLPDNAEILLKSLQEKYNTSDTIAIMQNELAEKKFNNVLLLFDLISGDRAKTTQMLLMKMKALEGIGDTTHINSFFQNTSINDAEFYLEKAKTIYNRKNYSECIQLLNRCLGAPHANIDYNDINREVDYYMAQCKTAVFDNESNEQTYKDALEAWWRLRSDLRAFPGHEYNKKAINELQRMAKKMQKDN